LVKSRLCPLTTPVSKFHRANWHRAIRHMIPRSNYEKTTRLRGFVMHILGIVTRTHDSGLAVLKDGVPRIVLEEERFNRQKHTRKFPFCSLKAACDDQGLAVDDIDAITTPWEMKSLRRNMFWSVAGHLPASLNMIPPSARPHVPTLIVAEPMG